MRTYVPTNKRADNIFYCSENLDTFESFIFSNPVRVLALTDKICIYVK